MLGSYCWGRGGVNVAILYGGGKPSMAYLKDLNKTQNHAPLGKWIPNQMQENLSGKEKDDAMLASRGMTKHANLHAACSYNIHTHLPAAGS